MVARESRRGTAALPTIVSGWNVVQASFKTKALLRGAWDKERNASPEAVPEAKTPALLARVSRTWRRVCLFQPIHVVTSPPQCRFNRKRNGTCQNVAVNQDR
jgi:hypothetical protein